MNWLGRRKIQSADLPGVCCVPSRSIVLPLPKDPLTGRGVHVPQRTRSMAFARQEHFNASEQIGAIANAPQPVCRLHSILPCWEAAFKHIHTALQAFMKSVAETLKA